MTNNDAGSSIPVNVESFFEDELERMQATIEHLATSLRASEEEKATLVSHLAHYTEGQGNREAELAQRVAALEAENKFLEEELKLQTELRLSNGVDQSPDAKPVHQQNGVASPPVRQRSVSHTHQRKELEWIAMEDKLYMWVQFRTRELQKVSELLAANENRTCEMAKLIKKLCLPPPPQDGPQRPSDHRSEERQRVLPASQAVPRSRTRPAPAVAQTNGSRPVSRQGDPTVKRPIATRPASVAKPVVQKSIVPPLNFGARRR